MSTSRVKVIPWDDKSADPVLDRHIIHQMVGTSLGANDLLRGAISDFLGSHNDSFLTYILSIVGMEVEGQEVSLGLILFKGDIPENLSERLRCAKLGRWVSEQTVVGLHLGSNGFADFRRIVRNLRSDLIGWAPGRFLEPVLILTCNDDTPFIRDVKILTTTVTEALTAHELYEELTSFDGNSFVIWIKPAGSIRVYSGGKLFGQIMRLRDAGGWTTRHVDRLVQTVQFATQMVGMHISDDICRRRIVVPSISISECRKGSTVVVMEEKSFQTLELNWNRKGVLVACKAKHAPVVNEQEVEVTEAEFENYLAQDGAVVISPTGNLLGMGTYFQGGPGGRRDTAAWLPTRVERCITIVTSQDGPIYLHWAVEEDGEKIGDGVRLDFIPTHKDHPIQLDPKKRTEEVEAGVPDLT